MTTNTNTRNEIDLLGTEELELVSGGWSFPQLYAAVAAASLKGPSQFEELPAGWARGVATCPPQPPQ
jgi:hypothetical protein